MVVPLHKISKKEYQKIIKLEEDNWCDKKDKRIKPASLTKTISAFANANGGEIFIGIFEDKDNSAWIWQGFSKQEDAKGHLQIFDELFELDSECSCSFLEYSNTYVLHVKIDKSRNIKSASNGTAYVRVGPQNIPCTTKEKLRKLELNKGIFSYEEETTKATVEDVSSSAIMNSFKAKMIPYSTPEQWLRKNYLIIGDKPTVCGVLLFSDLPQAVLPKRSGIKVYRHKTLAKEGTRESLDFDPITIEGCAYRQIQKAVEKTVEVVQALSTLTEAGFSKVKYPKETLHEIITNAIIHRDYSITDDIHIRIFENRVEVESPGLLPGAVTEKNILEERASRNGNLERVINKFPNPPNKDVGEGLNTAFRAMQSLQLKPPKIEEKNGRVIVSIRHEPLASLEQTIMDMLKEEPYITRSMIRKAFYVDRDYQLNRAFDQLKKKGHIESCKPRGAYRKCVSQSLHILEKLHGNQRKVILFAIDHLTKREKKKVLLSMPQGSGKTITTAILSYIFLQEKTYERIYCIASRKDMAEALMHVYKSLPELSENYRIETTTDARREKIDICIDTISSFKRHVNEIEKRYSTDTNNKALVITHSDTYSASSIKTISNYDQIGICSYPRESLVKAYGQIDYTYPIRDSVAGEDLVVRKEIDLNIEVTDFESNQLEGSLLFESLEFNKAACRQIADVVTSSSSEKSIVFCASINQALNVKNILTDALNEKNFDNAEKAVVDITSRHSVNDNSQIFRRFRDSEYPKIAVTVNSLSAGVRLPRVSKLFFLRKLPSNVLYNQMVAVALKASGIREEKEVTVFRFKQSRVNLLSEEVVISNDHTINIDSTQKAKEIRILESTTLTQDKLTPPVKKYEAYESKIEALKEFVKDFRSENIALKLALDAPWRMSRVQYKYLCSELEDVDISKDALLADLQKAGTDFSKEDSIVGLIRTIILGKKSVSYDKRASRGIVYAIKQYSFNEKQKKWLSRIEKQLQLEYVVDQDSMDRGAFLVAGGFLSINKEFNGRLPNILKDIHTQIWL